MKSTRQRTDGRSESKTGSYEADEQASAPWGHQSLTAPAPQTSDGLAAVFRTGDVSASLRTVLTRVAVGDEVSSAAFAAAFGDCVELPAPVRDVVLGSLMVAVMVRGPEAHTVEALLRRALAVDAPHEPEVISGTDHQVLMLAGSGKKGMRTCNVSTPAALVAAAAGAKVIKVGSAATSSALGSRDLVRALGLPEHRSGASVRAALGACGFAFVAVEPEIPVLDRLYGGRFHAPTPFSFGLAPLASPVRGDAVVFGLAHPRVDVAARVLSRFGLGRVHVLTTRLPSGQFLDEIGLAGELKSCEARWGHVGAVEVQSAVGLVSAASKPELPTPRGPEEAIERTRDLLAGGGLDSHRMLVALNAAHLLVLSDLASSLSTGFRMAEEILRSGAAMPRVPVARHADPDVMS